MTPKPSLRFALPLVLLCFLVTVLPSCNRPEQTSEAAPVHGRILAVNDFHGQLQSFDAHGKVRGGAAKLAASLHNAAKGMEDRTVIALAGDTVGASPADSALLRDEPAIMVMNSLANPACANKTDARCNMVSTLGNHEFDKGVSELLRLTDGGNAVDGPFLDNPWRGAAFPYVCANVIDKTTGKTLFPPYIIKKIGNIPVAFIGAVVKDTPSSSMPTNVARLTFLDEAEAINRSIPEIHGKGVHAIVAVIHQGGNQRDYQGPTDPAKPTVSGPIASIVNRLDADVDVVLSAHTHRFTNALVKNVGGRDVLVTQAFAKGSAYAVIDLTFDPKTKDIVEKTAAIDTTDENAVPDPAVADIVAKADAKVAPQVDRVICEIATSITRNEDPSGESALGDLVADAQRSVGGTDFAFMNPGGIRADLEAGKVTWGDIYGVQPFGNTLVTMRLTGKQIADLLAQQWGTSGHPRILQISGLRYSWTDNGPGQAPTLGPITLPNGKPLDPAKPYTVAVNSFLADGGDGFSVFTDGNNLVQRPDTMVDILVTYLKAHPAPAATTQGRITLNK